MTISVKHDEINNAENLIAPKLENHRHKVLWTDDGIAAYQDVVIPHLQRLQNHWNDLPPSKNSAAHFLQSTNDVLSTCAQATNKIMNLSNRHSLRSCVVPPHIKRHSNKVLKLWKKLKTMRKIFPAGATTIMNLEKTYNEEKYKFRKMQRYILAH